MAQIENNKRERFKRVASRRVESILSGIKSLSNCSNTNNYEYNDDDVQKMLKVIREELRIMETLYRKNLKDDNTKFNF